MSTIKEFTCIVCPLGCSLKTESDGSQILSVAGNLCKKGAEYAESELLNPVRTLTTTIKLTNSKRASVKSDKPLPKSSLIKIKKIIDDICLTPPIKIGDILIENIDKTGINIIATKNI